MSNFSLPITIVSIGIAFIYFCTVFIFINRWFGLGSSPGLMNVGIYTGLAVMCVYNYVLVVFTDPGRVPSDFQPDIDDSSSSVHEVKRKVYTQYIYMFVYFCFEFSLLVPLLCVFEISLLIKKFMLTLCVCGLLSLILQLVMLFDWVDLVFRVKLNVMGTEFLLLNLKFWSLECINEIFRCLSVYWCKDLWKMWSENVILIESDCHFLYVIRLQLLNWYSILVSG